MKKINLEQLQVLRESLELFLEYKDLDQKTLDLIDQIWENNYENFLSKGETK